ncbi:MAG: VWA domain-containing protein [Anaerolineae bacterium]
MLPNLGLTLSEFDTLSTSVREYLSSKYPFLRNTEFGVRYEKVDTPVEGVPAGSLVIDAYANFRTPPVVIRVASYGGEARIISEEVLEEDGRIRTLDLNRTIEVVLQPQQQEEHRNVEIDGDPNPEFIIHWRYGDFPNNAGADEVVDLVEAAARTSWNTICGDAAEQWDFDEPPDDDGGVDIYVNDNEREWGPYAPYGDAIGTFRWKSDTDQIIYIQHNLVEYFGSHKDIYYPAESDLFLVALSHEFFHCVQDAYSVIDVAPWIYEGTARFEQSVINPNGEFWQNSTLEGLPGGPYTQDENHRSMYIYQASRYLLSPELTLNTRDPRIERCYDACIYWRYIYEHLGGMDIIKDIFSLINTDNPTTFEAELDSINTALQPSTTVEDSFTDFAHANYLEFSSNPFARDNDFYEHSVCYYEDVALVHDKTYEYKGKTLRTDNWWQLSDDTRTESYAANYVEFVSRQKENDDVQILFSGNPSTTFTHTLTLHGTAYPQGEVVPFVDDSIIVPYPNDYDKIIIAVINIGHEGDGNYHVVLRPVRDADAVLDIDHSGSMGWDNKMQSAKDGAKAFIDLLEKPSGWWIFKTDRDRVGLVSFATSASLDLHLTSNFEQAKQVIDGYVASGDTNMGDALSKSIDELKTRGRDNTVHSIIYLTDGQTNTGLRRDEILDQLVPEAVDEGISIYTFGYGGDVDASFLQTLASRANGKYYFAPDADTLRRVYIELSHAIKGWSKTEEYSGYLAAGETETVGTLDIPAGLSLVKVVLTWPGSDLDLILLDPDGNTVDPGTTGILYSGDDVLPEYYELYDPQAGTWTIQVYGKDIPEATEEYEVFVFQPGALMQVSPTSWNIEYPTSRVITFTVNEVGASVDLTNVTFTASDLTKVDLTATREQTPVETELEGREELVPPSSPQYLAEEAKIPASSFSFSPNNFTVSAGGSQDVLATFTLTSSVPAGDYSGVITVTSNGGTTTIGVVATIPPALVLELDQDWNLTSFNREPADTSISSVLAPIAGLYSVVLGYDQGGLSYYPNIPEYLNTLRNMDPYHGYWIKTTTATTLPISGTKVAVDTPLSLDAWWNLVSYLPDSPQALTTALASIEGQYEAVLGYDQGALSYYPHLPDSVDGHFKD